MIENEQAPTHAWIQNAETLEVRTVLVSALSDLGPQWAPISDAHATAQLRKEYR